MSKGPQGGGTNADGVNSQDCSLGCGNLDFQNSEIDSAQQMREQVLITYKELGFDRIFYLGIPEVGAMGKESTNGLRSYLPVNFCTSWDIETKPQIKPI